MPDISLLPDIAIYFGITIDALFEMAPDKNIQRIKNMLNERNQISEQEFKEAEKFLLDYLKENRKQGEVYGLLASTYNFYGWQQIKIAEEYAKLAIENNYNEKDVHNVIIDANRGTNTDWNFYNHHSIIDYYKLLPDQVHVADNRILNGTIRRMHDGQAHYQMYFSLTAVDKNKRIKLLS